MTPLRKVEVTLPRVLGSRGVRRGGAAGYSRGLCRRRLCGVFGGGEGAALIVFGNSVGVGRLGSQALLFGLRLWASVSLLLYVAFWLELDWPPGSR